MRDVTVDKEKLLEILRANREKHLKVYKEARAGYVAARKQELLDHLQLLDDNKIAPNTSKLERPEKHEEDYDGVISMLEMDLSNTVIMDERTYRRLVLDQWHWYGPTIRKFSQYAAASTTANYGSDAGAGDDDDF